MKPPQNRIGASQTRLESDELEIVFPFDLPEKDQPVGLNIVLRYRERMAFMGLHNALARRNAKLRDGRPIYHRADTLRWLMERIADAGNVQ